MPRAVSKSSKRKSAPKRKSSSPNSKTVDYSQYPVHLFRSTTSGLGTAGMGLVGGVKNVGTGVYTGGSRMVSGVDRGIRNVGHLRLLRGPLRIADSMAMGLVNIGKGGVRGVSRTANGVLTGSGQVVRGITGVRNDRNKIQSTKRTTTRKRSSTARKTSSTKRN